MEFDYICKTNIENSNYLFVILHNTEIHFAIFICGILASLIQFISIGIQLYSRKKKYALCYISSRKKIPNISFVEYWRH